MGSTSYRFRVRATATGLSNGPWNDSLSVTTDSGTVSTPSAPSLSGTIQLGGTSYTGVVSGNAQIFVSWDPPINDGGSPIIGYNLRYRIGSGQVITVDGPSTSLNTVFSVPGLTNGSTTLISIRAENSAGFGGGDIRNGSPAADIPTAPTSISITPSSEQLDVSWSPPSVGSDLDRYYVFYRDTRLVNDWANWNLTSHSDTTTSTTITGLTNDVEYEVMITASRSTGSELFGNIGTARGTPAPDVSSVPQNLVLTPSDGKITATWTAPSDEGASAITDYDVDFKLASAGADAWNDTSHSGTGTSFVIDSLTNGLEYDVRVGAINDAGTSDYAESSATPRTTPGAPGSLTLTPENLQLGVSWSAPTDNGGNAISGYKVEYRAGTSGTWLDFAHSGTGTSTTITGLTNGTLYQVQVAAINAAGTGTYTTPVSETPSTQPGAPTALTLTPDNTQISASWTAPSSNGGSPITGYDLEYRLGESGDFTDVAGTQTSTDTSAVISSLTNGQSYQVRVAAINARGTGPFTDPPDAATPSTTPGTPTGLTVTSGPGQISVAWTAPANDGGNPISGYDLEYKLPADADWTDTAHSGLATSYTIMNLSNGQSYQVRVAAVNINGNGDYAESSATPRAPPGEVTGLMLASGDAHIVATWSAPSDNGGDAITRYVVEYKLGSDTAWTDVGHTDTTLTATISGLTNGEDYDVRVAARNSVGVGDFVQSSISPSTQPEAPTNLVLTPGNSQITVSWTAPSSGGADITGYHLQYKESTSLTWINSGHSGTGTSFTIISLTNGTSYDVRVAAINDNGTGDYVDGSTTPRTMPGAPENLVLTRGNAQITVTWDAPTNNGGDTVSDYDLDYKLASASGWTDSSHSGAGTSFVITGLTNGSEYDVRIAATNGAGPGPYVEDSATPLALPGPPTGLMLTPGHTQIVASWAAPANTGGSPITGYRVEYRVGQVGGWSHLTSALTSTATTATITGLTNGSLHQVRVSAINNAGTGSPNADDPPLSTTPRTMPGIPTDLTLGAGNAEISVSWTAPTNNGGNAITGYDLEYRPGTSGTWTDLNSAQTSLATTATIDGLTNGQSYQVRVAAINDAGTGTHTNPVAAMPMAGVPGTPASLTLTPENTQIVATWTPPSSDGGSQITNYDLDYKKSSSGADDWNDTTRSGTGTTFTITGLENGTAYDVRVAAINVAGTGAFIEDSTTPRTTPGKPTSFSLLPRNGEIRANWSLLSDNNGGSPITGFQVEYRAGTSGTWNPHTPSQTSTTPSATITGLTNGTSYQVRVAGINAAGTGTYTDIESTTPRTTPGVPASLSLAPSNGQLTATWTAPTDNGGNAVSGYDLDYKLTSDGADDWDDTTHSGTGTSFVISGLTNGTSYDVRIAAENAAGTGPYIARTATAARTPDAPTNLTLTRGNTQIEVTWVIPSNNGGSAVTGYSVQYKAGTSSVWLDTTHSGTGTSFTITGLTNGTEYDVRVAAINAAGTGGLY